MVQSESVSLLPGGVYTAAPSRKTRAKRVAVIAAAALLALAAAATVAVRSAGPTELYAPPQQVQEYVVERAPNGVEYLEPLGQGPQVLQQQPPQPMQYQAVDTVAPAQVSPPAEASAYPPAEASAYPPQLPDQLQQQKPTEAIQLQQALASAEQHTETYEQQLDELQGKVHHWDRAAKEALAQIHKVRKFKHWAKVESAAAQSLKTVQETARERLARQQAISRALRPSVELEVEKRRVVDDRTAQAEQQANQHAQYQGSLAYQLQQAKAQLAQAKQRSSLTGLSFKAMSKRAEDMEVEAKQDDKQAAADIKLARASVLGARKNADKTLATLRESLHPKKNGKKVDAVAQAAAEASFAAKAHQATLTMNSKKVEAKQLREKAARLRTNAKELQMVADERHRQVPVAKQQALEAQARVTQLQSALKQSQHTGLPFNNAVRGAQELEQTADASARTAVAELSTSQNKLTKAQAFYSKAHKAASKEERKAREDAAEAEGHLAAAHKMYVRALSHKKRYETRLKSLSTVLASAKTELASLKAEAAQVLAAPQPVEMQ